MSLLIRAATVVDGTERPRYRADVLVDGPRIAAIRPPGGPPPAADRVIDADGLVLSPGFIDMHAHSDLQLLLAARPPRQDQPGRDHRAARPGRAVVRAGRRRRAGDAPPQDRRLELRPRRLRLLLAQRRGVPRPPRPSGHRRQRRLPGAARRGPGAGRAAGTTCPPPPPTSRAMQEIVRTAMEQGAVGLSGGLTYTPGMYADNAELARAVPHGRRAGRLLRPAPPLVRQGRTRRLRRDDRPDDAAPAARCTCRTRR